MSRCLGCGAILQIADSSLAGYSLSLDHKYCHECFVLVNYGLDIKRKQVPIDLEILDNSLCLIVVSVLLLDQLFFNPSKTKSKSVKYLYIINQIDLLPISTNLEVLLNNIIKVAQKNDIYYEDIILMSAHNFGDIERLKAHINTYSEKNVFLVGIPNAGKTTIFKKLINNNEAISNSKFGLTKSLVQGQMDQKVIFDTPGFISSGYLNDFFSYDVYKGLIPNKRIKPKLYQVVVGSTLEIEKIIYISFLKGNKTTFVFYLNNEVNIKRVNFLRLEGILTQKEANNDFYNGEFESKIIELDQGKKQITFADLGFLHLSGQVTIKVTYPKGLLVTSSEALFR